ncbi:peptidylprolyl isomerase [Enterococcus sp. BWR-S5]|uniref:peptidylprolyl isomerase n=1 Tax=Enterococcus sp. BWR-S5 TaxID=2787714 RepID=UPI001921B007|nr:peptidylprolyl isomerase [Enterococcus sp. BWR-S5]MBL1224236.1 peptidylprolyl isomerase [Enterococcus sp. BWR-S5]
MKKKLILAAAGALSIFALAACSSSSEEIATMKGAKITVEDFYNEIKNDSDSQSRVANMIIYKVFEDKYGDKVSTKDVDAKYDEIKENAEAQGQNLDDYLEQYGYTQKSYKALIKQSLAFEAGIKSHVEITDEDLKTAWDSFHPEVEAQIITVATEEEAKEIKADLDKDGDFTKIAKEKSTDTATKEDGGKVKFDSTSTEVPAAVQEAAFKLKNDEVSEPIAVTDSTGYQTVYYLVKMTKTSAKGNDMDPYKEQLEEIATTNKTGDSTFQSKVVSDELKEANVKIKDDAFKDVLAQYIQTEESSTEATEASSNTKESTKEESSTDSSAKTSDSSSATEESSSK